MKRIVYSAFMTAAIFMGFTTPIFAAESTGNYSPEMQAKIDEVKKELKEYTDARTRIEKDLKTFDELDFVVFSNQEWTRLHESHSKDVKVNCLMDIPPWALKSTSKISRQCLSLLPILI